MSIDVARNNDIQNALSFVFPFVELAVFYFAARYSPLHRNTLFHVAGAALGMRALIMIYQYLTGSYLETEMEFSDTLSYTEIGGIVVQRPIDAAVSLFSLVIIARLVENGKPKAYLYLLLLLCLAVSLMSLTRSIWVAIAIGAAVCIVRFGRISWRAVLYSLVLLGMVSALLYLRNPELADMATAVVTERVASTEHQLDSDLGRLRIYENEAAIEKLESPVSLLFGIGYAGTIDTVSRNMDSLIAVRKQYIHNYHLLVLVKTGIIVFLAYLYFLWRISSSRNALVSTFSVGLFVFITFQPVVLAFHLFALLGLVIGLSQDKQENLSVPVDPNHG